MEKFYELTINFFLMLFLAPVDGFLDPTLPLMD